MEKFFIFFFLLLSLPIKAQDTLEITYSCLARNFIEKVVPSKYDATLNLNVDYSVFSRKPDALEIKYGKEPKNKVYKNFRDGKIYFSGQIGFEKVATSEPIPDFQWEMLEGDSIVCDYHCQKARTTFRGRTWVVWYSLDLPYSDGPWKLSGLPGLILKATDMKGDFSFSAYKIEKEQEKKNSFSTKGMAMMSPQKYTQKFLDYYDEMNHREYNITIGGKPYKPEPRTPCLMEYFDDIKK